MMPPTGPRTLSGQSDISFQRRRLLAKAGLLALASFVPMAVSAAQSAAARKLNIGILGPFSGPASGTGRDIRQGILMALEDARAEGEIPVIIEGRPLDINPVWIDSRSDPVAGAAAVTGALARENIDMMLGGWHSAVALEVMDIEAPYGIVHLGSLGSAQVIADKINQDPVKYRGWFKGWPSPVKLIPQYREPLNHFRQQGLWQPASLKAAIAVEDTAWGYSWGKAMASTLQGLGFETLPLDVMQLDQTDFGSMGSESLIL
jgi:ABC-type branched-subunit amino acid transport system substrate-binding protein